MKFLVILIGFISCSAYASTSAYDLKIQLSLNGKTVSSPRVVVTSGQTATLREKVNQEERFIEVTASEGAIQNHKGIFMNFVVGVVDPDGKKIVKATPQILAQENKTAQITVVDELSKEEISLTVTAIRK